MPLNPTLIDRYAERLRGNPVARRQSLAIINAWGKHVSGDPDRASVDRRLQAMQKAGYAPATIDLHWRQIRSFFNANKLEWPYRRGEGPKIRERDVIKLALGDDLIERMVRTARKGYVSPVDTAHLALATVYGMRRSEIGNLTINDINLVDRSLYIQTLHNGREREHAIPDALLPVLETALPHISRARSEKTMTRSFLRIEKATGLDHTDDLGWHAIRRTLDTRLVEQTQLSSYTIKNFLRWKLDAQDMAERYARNNTFVTGNGAGTKQALGDREIDQQVFAVHPFLPYWEANT